MWYRKRQLRGCVKLILFSTLAYSIGPYAQQTDLEEITVYSTRMEDSLYDVPAAVSIISGEDVQLGRQQLGLDESLSRVPGIFMQNRYNFAQDLRVSIRGFGARANFGIRGLKVFVDEIPSTLADGQSGVDDVDLGSTGRIEVIRGPSSSLYGSSSGGVISLYTEDGPDNPFAEAGVTLGAYDQQKYQLKAGGQHERLNYLLNASHLTLDGYRDHSELEHTLFNSKFRYDIDETSDFTVILNLVDSPTAQDAGGITTADIAANRRQAQPRNLSSNADESVEQQKLGFVYHKSFNDQHRITLRNYYLWREFQNFLPIGSHIPFVADDGVVEFDRFFFGGGIQYAYEGRLFDRPDRFTMGFDIDMQEDDRQRFINNAGIKGTLSFNQLEEAESYGFYFRNTLEVMDNLSFIVGGRYDMVDLSVEDRYLANADQSGMLEFDEFSTTLGLLWSVNDNLNVYFNYATSFETPTFTELANPARNLNVNLGGFANVAAQTADSFEAGIKGSLGERILFDIAGFTMQVDDEIINVTNIGARGFFENADTDRNGLEFNLFIEVLENLDITTAYTYTDFEFDRFPTDTTLVGNTIPGIPEHQFFTEISYHHDSGFYLAGDVLVVDEFFADNANTVVNDSYTVANLRAGYRTSTGNWELAPFFGINNLFDEEYNSNVRINTFGGRYFEPAPEIHVYGGLSVRYGFQ